MQYPDKIKLYGRSYARTERAAVASLFQQGGTVSGFYRATAQGVYLSDLQGQERLFIRRDGLGPVSVSRDDHGRRRYMFAASTADEKTFGIPDSYGAQCDGARALARALYPTS